LKLYAVRFINQNLSKKSLFKYIRRTSKI